MMNYLLRQCLCVYGSGAENHTLTLSLVRERASNLTLSLVRERPSIRFPSLRDFMD
jgi:hypothetical protein